MLNLHFAPSAGILVPELLGRIRSVWTDPFQPPTILVPSPAVGKWLQLRLADCGGADTRGRLLGLGCVANLEMLTLERFFWNAFAPAGNMRIMDVAIMQQVICALLDSGLLNDRIYESVNAYLRKADGTTDPVKRVQLASRVARQFQEYEFNRPSVWDEEHRRWRLDGVDAKWLQNKPYFGDTTGTEAWQMDLYCKMHGQFVNAIGQDKIRYISLPRLYRLQRENSMKSGTSWTVKPGHIFMFGISKVSHFHRNTLVEISQMPGMDMHVLLTNPCAEFWEDVDTRRNRSRLRRAWTNDSGKEEAGIAARSQDDYHKEELKDLAQPPPARDHALLELWGNAGKANIFLWCARAQWSFEYYSPDWAEEEKVPDTLLKAIQYSLLRCQNELKGGWKTDASLQVLACPDPGREVEELREQVLDLMKNNGVVRLNEIAVYLPDPGAYLSQIHRVFGSMRQNDPGFIPYSVLGAPGSDSLFAQGMLTLLEIFEGRFDRARIFTLLRNPIVQSTRKISPQDVAIWERWAENLGIFRGYNSDHRKQMGDRGQAVTDAHTFELGIARLLIGNLAADPVDMKFRLPAGGGDVPADAGIVPVPAFRDFDTSDTELLETFCGLAEDLYKSAGLLAVQTSLSASVDIVTSLERDWFGGVLDDTTGVMTLEGRVRNEFLEALSVVKMQDDLAKREERTFPGEFLALARECLPQELPAGSRAWTGGITFAPLRPSMIVPHKVVFVLGLDATAFPGTSDKPGWDLLSHRHIVGDSDPVRDNRFAFLELLHAAGERLVLSFRARDMQKEEDLQPSSVVLELESYLNGQGSERATQGSPVDRCIIRRTIPWIVRESLDELTKQERPRGSWDPSDVRLARIESHDGTRKATYRYDTVVPAKANVVPDCLRTTIRDLRRFFANPLEYHLSRTLGIENDELPATMGATDEPLQSLPLTMSGLQKAIWTELLLLVFPEHENDACVDAAALGEAAENIVLVVHANYVMAGRAPEAQLCRMEERFLVSWARQCAEATLDLRRRTAFGNHRLVRNADASFARPGLAGDVTVDLGNGRECAVECRHELALAPRQCPGEIGIIGFRTKGTAKENPDLWLTGAVQTLAERKCAEASRFSVQLVQLNRGNGSDKPVACDTCPFTVGKPDDLGDWLGWIVQDMLVKRCADHLPLSVIMDLTKPSKKNPLTWDQRCARVTAVNIEEKLAAGDYGPYKCYLETFKLVEPRIPFGSEADEAARDRLLVELVKKRYAPMLEGMTP
jgi:exonuclease V gamma subunit